VGEGLRTYRDATVVLTGAASGIGRALAHELAERRAELVLVDRDGAEVERTAHDVQKQGCRARVVEADVRDADRVAAAVRSAFDQHGRLDYMFNNAGISIGGETQQCSLDDWNQVIDVNFRGVVHGVHAAYGIMVDQGFGHIVNTASVAGLSPVPLNVSYGATKHAVVGLTTSLRAEAAAYGVRVSALCPGAIDTPILIDGGKYGSMRGGPSPEKQRAIWQRARPIAPALFARRALDQIAKNRALVVVPSWWRSLWWVQRLHPDAGIALATAVCRGMRRESRS
jgi:NADP-dependent 3-hydroxy acid dehydrogenase YdfG